MLDDYLSRVHNATHAVVSASNDAAVPAAYPRRRERQLALTSIRVGLLDFLSLGRCGLQTLVGERNSLMGKVQPISQRLVYEHRFLVKAAACRRRLLEAREPDEDFIAQIDSVMNSKQRDLPKLFWNATFGSPEFEKLFARSSQPLAAKKPEMPSPGMTDALRYFVALHGRLGDPRLQLSTDRLEKHYFAIQAQAYVGKVLRSIALLASTLSNAANALEHRASSAPPICFRGKPTPAAEVLQLVFHKYYVQRVGPYVATVHRYGREVLRLANQLAQVQLDTAPPSFRDYYRKQISLVSDHSLWQKFTDAIASHTKAWGLLLASCNMLPRGPLPGAVPGN